MTAGTEELDPSLVRLLGEYLKADETGKGPRDEVRELSSKFDDLGKRFEEHLREDLAKHADLDKRLAILETAAESEADTGVHDVADLRRKYRELKTREKQRTDRENEHGRAVRGFLGKVAVAVTIAALSWLARGLSFSPAERPAQAEVRR